jgi:hypothetical protein
MCLHCDSCGAGSSGLIDENEACFDRLDQPFYQQVAAKLMKMLRATTRGNQLALTRLTHLCSPEFSPVQLLACLM